MGDLRRRPGRRRHRPWLPFGLIGVAGIAGWWAAPAITDLTGSYVGLSLGDKDSVASVVSMVTGLASLAVAVLFGWAQLRGHDAEAPDPAGWRPSPEQKAADRLRAHLGRNDRLRRISDRKMSGLALRVHPALDAVRVPHAPAVRWWQRLIGDSVPST